MKTLTFIATLLLCAAEAHAAGAFARYRGNDYKIVGVNNENLVIDLDGKSKTVRADMVSFLADESNQLKGVNIELKDLLVTINDKGKRSLIIQAEIRANKTIDDCYLILVSGSSNDIRTVARALPELATEKSAKVSFAVRTSDFTQMDPYQLCLFSKGNSIAIKGGENMHRGRITPYSQHPRVVFQERPVFPAALVSQYTQATVIVEFTINEDGLVTKSKIIDSPHKQFSSEAIRSLDRSKFRPRFVGGVAQETRLKQAIVFKNAEPKPAPEE